MYIVGSIRERFKKHFLCRKSICVAQRISPSIEVQYMHDLKITQTPIDALIPFVNNARTHTDAQVAQIAASIREFGWTNPVLTDGNNGIIAGHGRVLAARKLGMETVPTIALADLTETQKRAYIIADNKLAEQAGWDTDLLALELAELKIENFDLNLLGFNTDEIDDILGAGVPVEGLTDEDEVPEPQAEPVSALGDIWLLDTHRVMCGDSTDAGSVALLMDGKKADMAFTDPPYNVDYGNTMKDKLRHHTSGKKKTILNDNLGEGFGAFLQTACDNMLAVVEGAVYICMSSSELDTLQDAFRRAGGHWSTFIIWAKNTFTIGRSDYQRQYEPILYGWPEKSTRHWCGDRDQADVWFVNKPVRNDLHPTMKPVELIERAIANSSKKHGIVLDLFGGSGSTLIACEKTGRRCLMMELDPLYVDVIIRRWQEYAGKQAVRESDGVLFDVVACRGSETACSA